jgi:hypothetical protein
VQEVILKELNVYPKTIQAQVEEERLVEYRKFKLAYSMLGDLSRCESEKMKEVMSAFLKDVEPLYPEKEDRSGNKEYQEMQADYLRLDEFCKSYEFLKSEALKNYKRKAVDKLGKLYHVYEMDNQLVRLEKNVTTKAHCNELFDMTDYLINEVIRLRKLSSTKIEEFMLMHPELNETKKPIHISDIAKFDSDTAKEFIAQAWASFVEVNSLPGRKNEVGFMGTIGGRENTNFKRSLGLSLNEVALAHVAVGVPPKEIIKGETFTDSRTGSIFAPVETCQKFSVNEFVEFKGPDKNYYRVQVPVIVFWSKVKMVNK